MPFQTRAGSKITFDLFSVILDAEIAIIDQLKEKQKIILFTSLI
jgi:hypothetical protein